MDRFKWRIWAKVIAVIDLTVTSMALLILITAAVIIGFSNVPTVPGTSRRGVISDDATASIKHDPAVFWVFVGFLVVFFFSMQLCAAVMLLRGTELGRDPADAYRPCAIYRSVCWFFTVLGVTLNAFSGRYIALLINLLIRGLSLIVVHSFMGELKRARDGPGVVWTTAQV